MLATHQQVDGRTRSNQRAGNQTDHHHGDATSDGGQERVAGADRHDHDEPHDYPVPDDAGPGAAELLMHRPILVGRANGGDPGSAEAAALPQCFGCRLCPNPG